jgi:hypothetical protein
MKDAKAAKTEKNAISFLSKCSWKKFRIRIFLCASLRLPFADFGFIIQPKVAIVRTSAERWVTQISTIKSQFDRSANECSP